MNAACLARPKAIASSVAVSQACSAVTMPMRSGNAEDCVAWATLRFRKLIDSKPRRAASSRDFSTSSARVSIP